MNRLFLGLPVPAPAARELAAWSATELPDLRTIPAENLHATLLFFGSVDAATRDELVALTREVAWDSLPAQTAELAPFGRSAVAVRLKVPEEPLARLEDRLARASAIAPPNLTPEEESGWLQRTWPKDDPLYRMALRLPESENEKKRRRQRKGTSLDLHVTLARRKSDLPPGLLERHPLTRDLLFDRLVLYESVSVVGGVRYVERANAEL